VVDEPGEDLVEIEAAADVGGDPPERLGPVGSWARSAAAFAPSTSAPRAAADAATRSRTPGAGSAAIGSRGGRPRPVVAGDGGGDLAAGPALRPDLAAASAVETLPEAASAAAMMP
jgi:hypothetical protein